MNSRQETNLPPGLSGPAWRALTNAGYRRLGQIARVNEAEVERLHGVGPKALAQLQHTLVANGLSFADGKEANRSGTPE
jgi:hypothetical protein